MNKAQLTEEIAQQTGLSPQQAEQFLDAFVTVVTNTLKKGEEVTITGFGAFMPKFRSSRMGVDPRHPDQRIQIPAVTIPKFKAGKVLKDALKHSGASGAGEKVTTADSPATSTEN